MSTLENLTVLLTRTPADSEAWAAPLRAAGAAVVILPCIRTEPATDPQTAAELRTALAQADWLVLTSRRGVDALAALVGLAAVPTSALIAVVGAATARSAESRLGRVDLIAPTGTARALGAAMIADPRFASGQHCVAALAANAGPVLGETLEAAGARYRRIDVYRTIPQPASGRKRTLSSTGASDVVFSSPTTVTGFVNQIDIDRDYRAWSIGPSTSAALEAAGLTVTGEAEEPGIAGIIAIIAATLGAGPGTAMENASDG